jgi:glycosyltransferase involved in cell wall biosynthesis
MRKIVFVLQTMVLGGVEKELISVLRQIENDFDITVLLLTRGDEEILKEIPDKVKLRFADIEKGYYLGSTVQLIKARLKKGKISEAISIALKRFLKIGMTGANLNISDIPIWDDNFDVAICYHIHSPLLLRYVSEKINSKKKIAWIHSSFYDSGYPIERLRKYVERYDGFVAVSEKVEREFRNLCPWYKGRISTAYNYIDEKEIIRLSDEPENNADYFDNSKVKILTVARFSEEKGIDNAIRVCAALKKEGKNFCWFLIGYGELENRYIKLIKKYEISDCFVILGRKSNPYPYIKNCDIYVQPSKHEAFGMVIKEAKILKRPIVCTNFDGADEQIENGKNGIIVPLNDESALQRVISSLIESSSKREALSRELYSFHAEDELKKIIKHFE